MQNYISGQSFRRLDARGGNKNTLKAVNTAEKCDKRSSFAWETINNTKTIKQKKHIKDI